MKLFDYILLSHIVKKHSYYESQKRLERERRNTEERKQTLAMMTASPVAAFFYFASVTVFIICFNHRPVRWICTFTALYSMFTIVTGFMLQQGERQRHLLLSLSAFISTSGLFVFFQYKTFSDCNPLVSLRIRCNVFLHTKREKRQSLFFSTGTRAGGISFLERF